MGGVDHRVRQEGETQRDEGLTGIALKRPCGQDDHRDRNREVDAAEQLCMAARGKADPRATDDRERQRHPMREPKLADQPLGFGRVDAHEPPHERTKSGTRQECGDQQDAGGLGHGFPLYLRPMRAVDLIRQKRDGGELSAGQIRAFVEGATDGSWPDYQLAALLMAIVWRGMTRPEAVTLTDAMVRSGDRLDLSEFGGTPVDKHSTGGVGDKLSLVIAPLVAACGGLVPMMSGRGLGHTGGTLDKLESIPGFRTQLSLDEMRTVLRATRCVLIGQTADIAPADRRLYALRDVTGTVESIPLICASILSKKIAEGIGALVLDVKVGSGAFMKTLEDARQLAAWLVSIAGRSGVRTEAMLTPMDAPLGLAVGNANEVIEAIETLKGRGPTDVETLSVRLAARMLVLSGISATETDAESRVRQALVKGDGLETFRAIIAAQHGDPHVIDDYARLPHAQATATWSAPRAGVVTRLDAELVGRAAVALGAGRDRVDGVVDPGAGIDIVAPCGSTVSEGAPVLRLMGTDPGRLDAARALLQNAVDIGDDAPAAGPLVIDVIAADGTHG